MTDATAAHCLAPAPGYDDGVELREEEPDRHEIGNRTYFIAPVEPLDVDGVRTVQVGTGLFLVAFVALVPFYGRLEDLQRTWVLWMCLAGVGLGLLGAEYCRRRRNHRANRPTPDRPTGRSGRRGSRGRRSA